MTHTVEVFTGFTWRIEAEFGSKVEAFRHRQDLIADPSMRACDVRIVSLP